MKLLVNKAKIINYLNFFIADLYSISLYAFNAYFMPDVFKARFGREGTFRPPRTPAAMESKLSKNNGRTQTGSA